MPESLNVELVNNSQSPNVHAYITGIAIQQGNRRCFLRKDGQGLYFPADPDKVCSALEEDCAIPLGQPGSRTSVTIPQIAGGRFWIADGLLTFLLNPTGTGAGALVEPSVLNPGDPNASVDFGFAEFTLNDAQLYANISYVDFVPRVPIAISLQESNGTVQRVEGMAADGIDRLAAGLREQASKDGRPWDKLIVGDGKPLRVLNATHGGAVGAVFDGYYEPLVEEVWQAYRTREFSINTQADAGVLQASTKTGKMQIGTEEFERPNTADIFSCNSGPFTTGPSPVRNAIIPRLAAAFVRSTLPAVDQQPSEPSTYYKRDPTNHYARLVHECNLDGKGYAFAYDDVQPDGGEDQSGKVNAGDPVQFTIQVGGPQGYSS